MEGGGPEGEEEGGVGPRGSPKDVVVVAFDPTSSHAETPVFCGDEEVRGEEEEEEEEDEDTEVGEGGGDTGEEEEEEDEEEEEADVVKDENGNDTHIVLVHRRVNYLSFE